MNYLLFAFYLVIVSSLVLRVPLVKNCGISSGHLLTLFWVKLLAGVVIGWVSIHIYGPGNDYWDNNDFARQEYRLLLTDPFRYFTNLFVPYEYTEGYGGIFSSYNSFWNDLENNIVIKLVSLFNVFSRGDYYINSLFFNSFIFSGHVIFYRLFSSLFPGKKVWVITGCFLLPSTLYFSSGIHKDGLVFLMLSVLLYCAYLLQKQYTVKRLLGIVISLAALFVLRNFVFLALLPALFAWMLATRTRWAVLPVFAVVYTITALLFFNAHRVVGKIRPMDIIVTRQLAYMNLGTAATQIPLSPLQPTFASFTANAPQALNHSFMRPYAWDKPTRSTWPFALELLAYWLLFGIFLFYRRSRVDPDQLKFIYFSILFTVSVFLIIGYIVPNLGSLVRYRSLYLPLIITPLLCTIRWGDFPTSKNIVNKNM